MCAPTAHRSLKHTLPLLLYLPFQSATTMSRLFRRSKRKDFNFQPLPSTGLDSHAQRNDGLLEQIASGLHLNDWIQGASAHSVRSNIPSQALIQPLPEETGSLSHRRCSLEENVDQFDHIERFVHEPLDQSRPSIRLVSVLPRLSADGLIQCRISYATTACSYLCLSYVWDYSYGRDMNPSSATTNDVILMNGRRLLVRNNLFDFLRVAQRRLETNHTTPDFNASTRLFIDALCIDQGSGSERNHQVAQMGTIYSHATSVLIWLGMAHLPLQDHMAETMPSEIRVTDPLESTVLRWKAVEYPAAVPRNAPPDRWYEQDMALFLYIYDNPYGERAWVVQEICVAKSLAIWLDVAHIELKFVRDIANRILKTPSRWYSSVLFRMKEAFEKQHYHFLDYHRTQFRRNKQERISPPHLVSLLDGYANKKCTDPRDRIFSMLSLCELDAASIQVGYTMSLNELACRVMHVTNPHCLCAAIVIAQALDFRGWIHARIENKDIISIDSASRPK